MGRVKTRYVTHIKVFICSAELIQKKILITM